MKISINTLSYKRSVLPTLDYLPFIRLWVCETEYSEYRKNYPNANIIKIKKSIQGNVSRVRNYILDKEFNRGVDAVCIIDDDMRGIFRHDLNENNGAVSTLLTKERFKRFVQKNSLLCKEWGFKLWGLALNKDKLNYLQFIPFNTKAMVLGPFTVHLKNDIRYDERLFLKEDYDLCLQHINKYRGVLRLNAYFYDCKQSTNLGGCALQRNIETEKKQLCLLQKKWGKRIVQTDTTISHKTNKKRSNIDYNPIIKIPINGV